MNQVELVIIGGGWRSQFFLLAARDLPERFRVSGMLVRNPEKGAILETRWGVKTYRTLDELLSSTKPMFAVVSVSKSSVVEVLEELSSRKIPAITETPPGADVVALDRVNELSRKGARIQVAEQYIFQPCHSARLSIVKSGLLGTISQAQVSFNQGYHGISLIRHYLGIKSEPLKLTAMKFDSPIYKGPDRAGPPREEKLINCTQTIAWMQWGDKLGVFDFAQDQHRSYIRSDRVLIRGEKGEINQYRVRYLKDYLTPITFDLVRHDAGIDGNLEGYHHKGITGGERWWYRNPFVPARLGDDEIAVTTCMEKMIKYAQGGPDFYSLAEASYDQHLALSLEEAIRTGVSIEILPRDWAKW